MILQLFQYLFLFFFGYCCFKYLTSNTKSHNSNQSLTNIERISTPHLTKTLRNRFSHKKIEEDIDIIIIGSGISSLITASYLSKFGKKILVLEQHYIAGGCTHNFNLNKMTFDTGLHYVSNIEDMDKILNTLGDTNINIEWSKMGEKHDGLYDLITLVEKDGSKSSYEFLENSDNFINKLSQYFPQKKEELKMYVDILQQLNVYAKYLYIGKIFNLNIVSLFLNLTLLFVGAYNFLKKNFNLKIKKLDRLSYFIHISTQNTYSVVNSIVKDDKITNVLTGQYGDVGLIPQKSPFLFHAMLTNYYLNGGYYPIGGSRLIAHKLISQIINNGSQVLVSAPVNKLIIENNECIGVVVKNKKIYAKKIVSGIGILNTALLLDDYLHVPYINNWCNKINKFKPSTSHLSLFIVFKDESHKLDLPDYNDWILLKEDISSDTYDKPYFISFPSAKDKHLKIKYPNRSSCIMITEDNYDNYNEYIDGNKRINKQEYLVLKERISQNMLEIFAKFYPNLVEHIESHFLGTPLTNKFYLGSKKGSSYGIEHNIDKIDYKLLRPQTPIKNLYLTGQDITMNGVAGAMGAGILTSYVLSEYNIIDYLKKKPLFI